MNIKQVPNILSSIRLFLVPIFVISFFLIDKYVALGVFVIASITDVIDGYIARHYNAVTEFGKILDPFADKLMKMAALISLTIVSLIPIWVTVLMIVCDLAMIISGICIYKKKITIQSNWIGKAGTLIISLGVVLSFFTQWIGEINVYVIYAGIIIAVIAGLDYVYIFFSKKINRKPKQNKHETYNSNLNQTNINNEDSLNNNEDLVSENNKNEAQ